MIELIFMLLDFLIFVRRETVFDSSDKHSQLFGQFFGKAHSIINREHAIII